MSTPALFAFAPNWRDEITETLGYATSVVQAIDGTEYRQGLRTNPRTVLSYTYTEHGTRSQSTLGIQAALWRNHADVVICPYWPDGQPITLQSGLGFVVPTIAGREFAVGALVAAVKPDGTGAYYEVTNIVVGSTSTAITTNKSDGLTFGAGDMLYPAYESEINGIVPSSRITAGVVEYQVTVEMFGRPQRDNGIQTYRNRPLFASRPNRVDVVPAENMRMLAIIESITGRNFRRDQPGREFVSKSHDYLIRNRNELHTLRTYLTAMQGQLHGFWLPNSQSDLAMVADTSAGGDVLTIRRIDYADTYAGLIGRSDIAITLRDGDVLYRTITDSTVLSADTEQIEVSPGFGAGLFAAEVAQISWLDKCRLASDEVTLTWDTAEVCRVTLPIRGIIESVEEPEYDGCDILGEGTQQNPWRVSNACQLKTLETDSSKWDGYIIMTRDVDMSEITDFSAIALNQTFTGHFDGNGHTISNIITTHGMFFRTRFATIQNLRITNLVANSTSDFVGGLVGFAGEGTHVANCSVQGSVSGRINVGGLLGYCGIDFAEGPSSLQEPVNVFRSSFLGIVSSTSFSCGGLIGYVHRKVNVAECFAFATVTGSNANYKSGLCGGCRGGSFINCYSTGAVTTTSSVRAGFTSRPASTMPTVTNSYSTCTVGNNGPAFVESISPVSGCFFNNEIASSVDITGLTGLNTLQFSDSANFPSFDFVNIWIMHDGTPRLRWEFL